MNYRKITTLAALFFTMSFLAGVFFGFVDGNINRTGNNTSWFVFTDNIVDILISLIFFYLLSYKSICDYAESLLIWIFAVVISSLMLFVIAHGLPLNTNEAQSLLLLVSIALSFAAMTVGFIVGSKFKKYGQ